MLGLENPPRVEDFDLLCYNLDPRTGQKLRPLARDGERVGMDITFNASKSVSLAREMAGPGNAGDPRIEEAHSEAVSYVMGMIESEIQTRVRGGRDGDRVTGNMVAWRVTHRDTRISAEDSHPDPSLHCHVFVLNTTYDAVEGKWKACQMGQIKHDAPFYEAAYHNRLAANLKGLGYGIRRKGKVFEIEGVSDELVQKFSRRTQYIEAVAAKLGITKPESKSKLGATTRLGKAKELADDLNGYYVSRLTAEERQQLGGLIGMPSHQLGDEAAVRYAISHEFYTKSVVEERKLYETAIRHGIGSVTVEGVMAEARKQGVLLKDGQATTRGVLAEERRIIDFAREGKGALRAMGLQAVFTASLDPAGQRSPINEPNSLGSRHSQTELAIVDALGQQKGRPDESKRPLGSEIPSPMPEQSGSPTHAKGGYGGGQPGHDSGSMRTRHPSSDTATLSPEQQAMVSHVLKSTDRMVLVVGDAGTGKTRSIKAAFEAIHRPIEIIAPGSEASRGVLRREGFTKADTVASFLLNAERQAAVKNGVIWVDEAGTLPIRDLSKLVTIARAQNARIVLQGDPKQHKAVVRHGNMMNVLQDYADLPVGRLTEIWRQNHKGYKAVVADIAKGEGIKGFDTLAAMDWVKQVDGNGPLLDAYFDALDTKRKSQEVIDRVLVVAPTHVEGEEITAEIRERLKERGTLGTEERVFDTLKAVSWSEAERGDVQRYDGTEVLQYQRDSGSFKAGQRVRVTEWKPGDRLGKPEHFAVYTPQKLSLAAGDVVRITANGKDKTGAHKLNNGSIYRVKGFTKDDEPVLSNGWVLKKDFAHITHGYVATSHASQGKTVDRVLIAMGGESLGAINAEQFYVSVSRGRDQATIFSDLPAAQLREAIQRTDGRKSATELMGRPKPKPRRRGLMHVLMRKAQERFRRLRDGIAAGNREPKKQLEQEYGGLER